MLRRVFAMMMIGTALVVVSAIAAPQVTWVNGDLDDGASLDISGSTFGFKFPAAPIKYDDFEQGTAGEVLDEGTGYSWNLWANQTDPDDPERYYPHYSTEERRFSGDTSALQAFGDSPHGYVGNCTMSLTDITDSKLYVHGYALNRRSPNGEATGARNVKIWQRNVGAWGAPTTRWDVYPMDGSSGHIYTESCESGVDGANQWGIGMPDPGSWLRLEIYHDRGTSSRPEYMEVRENLSTQRSFSNGGQPSCEQNRLYLMSYHSEFEGNGAWMDWYWSEIYVDNTQARIELGNASTWSACTHREIQIPSAWESSSISFTANLGTMMPGSDVFLYVVDENGDVNEDGYALTVGENAGGEDPGPPGQPGQPEQETPRENL